MSMSSLLTRPLGKTGYQVSLFGLGGEGVLRTDGRTDEAVKVINRAIDHGVNYCDTAPAYASSMDYYGHALGKRRAQVFLASKTHERTRDGSLRLLDNSLKRLRTDHLDLWQLHDLRDHSDLEQIFAKGGAIEALIEARQAKRVRFLGLTGHYDPAILLEAMRRFEFDSVLVALNAADKHRRPFSTTVLPEATRKGMAVIAMKVAAQGTLIGPGKLTMDDALGYALSLQGVSHAIIGCQTPKEVDDNVRIVRDFVPLGADKMRELEEKTKMQAARYGAFKKA